MPILINKLAKPIPNKVNGAKPGVIRNHRIGLFQPPQKITALKSPHQFVGALYISRSIHCDYRTPRRGRALRRWAQLAAPPAKQKKLRRQQALTSPDIKAVARLRDAPIHSEIMLATWPKVNSSMCT